MYKPPHDKFTIYEVEALKKELLEALKNSDVLFEIDMQGVEKVDMAAIQLLMATYKSTTAQAKTLKLHGMTEQVRESLRLCGCKHLVEAGA